MHSGAMCNEAWCASGARFKARSGSRPPSTKELFQIISKHVMNREIISGRKRGFSSVVYNLWPLLTPWVAALSLLTTPAWLKLKGMAGHWLVQHTAPVMAKPDGRPHWAGACYKYPTSCLLPTYSSSTLLVMHTLAHTYQFPSFFGLAHWTTERSQCWGPE